MWKATYRGARRIVVTVVGGTLLLFGTLLLVLPGPGLPLMFLALVVLGTEFVWARLWLRRLRVTSKRAGRRVVAWSRRKRRPPESRP